jgi:hypothetical protein
MATDTQAAASLAIGRIFGMMQRPNQPGDVEEYERCRSIILNAIGDRTPDWAPNYARDRRLGAAGD